MGISVSPIEDLVFVAPEARAGLIEVIDPRAAFRGRVLAAGPDARDVRVNDMVHLSPGKAIEAVFEQRRVWVTREPEILAVEDVA
jgi:hypothetical protein